MSDADLTNVKNASLAMLKIFDPSQQHVGLAVLGQSQTAATCAGTANARGLAAAVGAPGTWVTVPYPTNGSLSTDYLSGGALNNSSQLVSTISCLDHSSTRTNLGDPLLAMANTLRSQGRAGVPKGIILLTDGAANQPNTRSCKYANDNASTVKSYGIELFTIGFGGINQLCTDIDGTYRNATASKLLADMATQPTVDNGCTAAENADGDHYYCQPYASDLTSVFKSAANSLLSGAVKLVTLPGG